MPDVVESRAIEDLPSVSNVTDAIQFPVSQDGTAMRVSVGDLESKFTSFTLVSVTGNSASMTASEIYNAIVGNQKNVIVVREIEANSQDYEVCPIGRAEKNGSDYTVYFYSLRSIGVITEYAIGNSGTVTQTNSYNPQTPGENVTFTGDTRLIINYTPTSNTHAVNKAYVDAAVGSGSGSDQINIIVVNLSQDDNKVYHNGTAITGSQINNYVDTGNMVFLWHEGYQRIYNFTETVGTGGAKFVSLNESGTVSITVQPTTNDTFTGSTSFLPYINYDRDEGKVLGVVNGEWAKTGRILPAVTADDNGMVLGVVNGKWTLIDPSSFYE